MIEIILITSVTALVLLFVYIGTVIYLLSREPLQELSNRQDLYELVEKKFPSLEVVNNFETELSFDPTNIELRAELLIAYFTLYRKDHPERSREHATWFVQHQPLHPINLVEGHTFFIVGFSSEQERINAISSIKNIWINHLKNSPDDFILLRSAAMYFEILDYAFSKDCWQKFLERFPFSGDALENLAALSQFMLPTSVICQHPIPDLKDSLNFFKKTNVLSLG